MMTKNWEDTDKPRERMMTQGETALSNIELLVILISSGAVNESVAALNRRILALVGNSLTTLGKQTLAQLTALKGIGTAKAITILVAIEIGCRRAVEASEPQSRIEALHNIFILMQPLAGDLPHEEFWVLHLSSANCVIHKCRLSSGGITHATVDIRLLLKNALEQGAVAIILVHNHLSGNTEPSYDDIQLIQRVKTAAKTLDIKLLDYIIITEKAYESLVGNRITL